jgi:hypothetical protein
MTWANSKPSSPPATSSCGKPKKTRPNSISGALRPRTISRRAAFLRSCPLAIAAHSQQPKRSGNAGTARPCEYGWPSCGPGSDAALPDQYRQARSRRSLGEVGSSCSRASRSASGLPTRTSTSPRCKTVSTWIGTMMPSDVVLRIRPHEHCVLRHPQVLQGKADADREEERESKSEERELNRAEGTKAFFPTPKAVRKRAEAHFPSGEKHKEGETKLAQETKGRTSLDEIECALPITIPAKISPHHKRQPHAKAARQHRRYQPPEA